MAIRRLAGTQQARLTDMPPFALILYPLARFLTVFLGKGDRPSLQNQS